MTWSEKAWLTIQPIYEKTVQLPFVQELMDGTLPKEKFLYYIEQDSLYLQSYGRLLTGIATKLNNPEHIQSFITFANENMKQEKELHDSFIKEITRFNAAHPSPTCLLYSSYLLKHLSVSPLHKMLAAVLPCFVIYKEVGEYIYANQKSTDNPYKNWIDTYAGEEHIESVRTAVAICDEIAEGCTEAQRQEMLDAYVLSAKIEHIFWIAAYQQEQWPV
ncbi:MAG: thiaminase II [Bacteroidales bacterium]|nr:thiaminase II [Bacteroidales bacterium]